MTYAVVTDEELAEEIASEHETHNGPQESCPLCHPPLRGLRADIYRDDYRGSKALLRDVKQVTIVNVEGPFEPNAGAPAVVLEPNAHNTVKIVPVDQPEGMCGPMMGGAYVATSDSRFSAAIEKILGHKFYGAVALHDWFETWEEYKATAD